MRVTTTVPEGSPGGPGSGPASPCDAAGTGRAIV